MILIEPLVSIMIPTFNQAQYINQAVESALGQDYLNIEVIVSDDSNNNDTQNILQPYLLDKRFFYFKNITQLGRVGNYRRHYFNSYYFSQANKT